MLTPLSIISLDQGKIWRDPCPLLDEEAAAESVLETGQSSWISSAWVGLVTLFTTLRTFSRQA